VTAPTWPYAPLCMAPACSRPALHLGECGPAPTAVVECERHVLCDCAEDDDRVTAPPPDPQRPTLAPENAQEPQTPAHGPPGTPETLSGRLSAPDGGTA
jgi:hypothetical protein